MKDNLEGKSKIPLCPTCGQWLVIVKSDDGYGNKRDCCYLCGTPLKHMSFAKHLN